MQQARTLRSNSACQTERQTDTSPHFQLAMSSRPKRCTADIETQIAHYQRTRAKQLVSHQRDNFCGIHCAPHIQRPSHQATMLVAYNQRMRYLEGAHACGMGICMYIYRLLQNKLRSCFQERSLLIALFLPGAHPLVVAVRVEYWAGMLPASMFVSARLSTVKAIQAVNQSDCECQMFIAIALTGNAPSP